MSDRPKTSDGLPEDPDLAGESDDVNDTATTPRKSPDAETNDPHPGPHQEQGGMHS